MPNRLLIFIPAYNCEAQLPRVLDKINQHIQNLTSEILIIDNHSKDQTLARARQGAEKIKIKMTILQNKENYNLGGSIKRAFLYALENNYDYMITLHGDDQADIRDMLPILDNHKQENYDMVIGARFHSQSVLKGYSVIRIIGNKVLNYICSIINRRRVDDLIAGLNCYNINFFRNKFFLLFPDDLTFDVHVLLYAFSEKARIKYIPITWREEDQISNAKAIRQAFVILRLFANYCLKGKNIFLLNTSKYPPDFAYPSEKVFSQ